MNKSRILILDAAQECFFQHGYSTASIAMISRYAHISRVTIHKQFSSKEEIFREIVQNCLAEKDKQIKEYLNKNGDIWTITYDFLSERSKEVFDDISSSIVKADLVHAGHSFCQDLMNEDQMKTRKAIEQKLVQAIDKNEITLKKVGLSAQELAINIALIGDSLLFSNADEDPRKIMSQVIQVYKVATSF